MAVLADHEIQRMSEKEINPLIEPFDIKLLQPASYDVTLGNKFIVYGRQDRVRTQEESVVVSNGDFILATTQQKFNIPNNIAATLALKSSIGRKGVSHALACWADPGFSGEMTMELYVIGYEPVKLVTGMPIAQMIFMPTVKMGDNITCGMCSYAVKKPYAGKYQNQVGPTPAREDNDEPQSSISVQGESN